MKPPFTYFGGKLSVADRIAAALPPHRHYVEPFAGSLAVLLAKAPSRMETVNDLNGDLMNFWRVLRDQPADLERACALTPHSRAERQAALDDLHGLTDLERARRVWIRLTQGRAGHLGRRTGWRYYCDPRGSATPLAAYLDTYVSRIPTAARRLHSVSLECRPAVDVIAEYGVHSEVLIYADPPYLGSVRTANRGIAYEHEMRDETSHKELADVLHAARAAVVVSGYHSPLYAELYDGWHQAEISTSSGHAIDRFRTEVLWSNRPLTQQLALAMPP